MAFPLGRPVLAMVLIAAVSALAVALRPEAPQPDLLVWTFSQEHAEHLTKPAGAGFSSLVDQYAQDSGKSIRVEVLGRRAMDLRLVSLWMAAPAGGAGSQRGRLPDVVEIEIGSAGLYFRPPANQIAFEPLNTYLERSGWIDRILPARLQAYTKSGLVFGVPQDVHPVALTYRRDLFEHAGVDLAAASTWQDLHEACLRYQTWARAGGGEERWAIELPTASGDVLAMMLLAAGVNLVDSEHQVHLDDPAVAQAMALYARMVAGPQRIAAPSAPSPGRAARDLAEGRVAAMVTPDWRIGELRAWAPQLSGRLAMLPLPRLRPGDAPTSTWGGTMLAIPRGTQDPDAAWRLLEALYLNPGALAVRARGDVVPPVPQAWGDPAYQRADPLFGGQRIHALLVDLARQVPQRPVTPYTLLAQGRLTLALGRATSSLRNGAQPQLEQQCQQWLGDQASALRRYIRFADASPDD